MAWYLRERIALEVERYGREDEYVRIAGLPEALLRAWSSRREAIERLASKLGIRTAETPALSQQISLATRTGKDLGDPGERDERFLEEASRHVDRDALIAELLSHSVTPPTLERIRAVQRRCNEVPARLTRAEAVFGVPQVLEHIARESACVVSPEALETLVARVLRHPGVLALDGHRAGSSADARAHLAHTRLYSTLDYAAEEQAVQSAARRSLTAAGYALPGETIDRHLEALSAAGFPIGEQQRNAVHHLAGGDTPLSVCLGAAGSGKTLALRPVADLYRRHGKRVLATALAWNAAVHLATECGAHPYSLARLFTQVAAGTLAVDRDTVLLVDEAGMLSVREIRTVLDIAERCGAKVHFIGDLDQLQPIEAGPGLRLLVEELGAARIETIRRQRPDLEDLLTWRRGLDAATAAAHAPLLSEAERRALLAERDAFPGQGWQARASEAARRGDAGAVIDAYATRGRLHLESNFERAVGRIAEDWLRHRREHPEASRLVIARTNREVRALSRVLRASAHPAGRQRPSVTVSTSTGAPGKRQSVPLEIAAGDTLRVRTTLFAHRLFNGTLLSVDAVAMVRDGGRERVRITATTPDRRQVTFHADEARDLHGNVRLEYGYAATIASAQGLTADRVFLLADDRPPRETVYPALTRHRDRLDIYLDTAPLALAVRQYRSEEDWDRPVTRAELHDHLAHRWSRSGAKEAAHDYASDERRAEIASRIAGEAARRT
ncbi:MAG: AAA family ATPase, partial [Chloroflexi bacterium]|nr:AAA family ATPase [Chloroflexota bacterium]